MKSNHRCDGCGETIPEEEQGRWADVNENLSVNIGFGMAGRVFLCPHCYLMGTPGENALES